MRRLLAEADTITFVVGVALLTVGAWLIFPPAAFLLAGIVLCGAGYSAMLRRPVPGPGDGGEGDER